jgi:hypothetical protein
MKNFQELKEARPELAKDLESMSKEELLNHYDKEVSEKEELEEYKDDNEFFENEIEHIINLGLKWLKRNKKHSHYIFIKPGECKVVYTNTETEFI